MPKPNDFESLESLESLLKRVVLASSLLPGHIYYGMYSIAGDHHGLLIERQKAIQETLESNGTDAEKKEYAKLLLKYALIADDRRGNIYGWNASRNYFNAEMLFEKALKAVPPNDSDLKAEILTNQAKFYKSIVKDSSGILNRIQKTPQQICEIYKEISTIGRTFEDQSLIAQGEQKHRINTIEEQVEAFKSKLTQFLKAADEIAYPSVLINLASVKLISGNKIMIDPTWSRAYSSSHIEGILLTILGLKEGVDFNVQRNSISSNKFIIDLSNFENIAKRIDIRMAELRQPKNKDSNERKQQPINESHVTYVSPTADPKSYSKDRTPPIDDAKIKTIIISGWNEGKTENDTTRFENATEKTTYIDVDKTRNKISSNSASVESFYAIFKTFQQIYGIEILPVINVLESHNNESTRKNCTLALKKAGYVAEQINKIMKPSPVAKQSPALTSPKIESDLPASNSRRKLG